MKKTFWLSVWAMELGVQLLIACGLISSFYPIPTDSFLKSILPFFYDMVRPEREMSLYGMFIVATVAIQFFLLWFYRQRFKDDGLERLTRRRVLWGAGALAVQFTGAFHIFTHQDPFWARALLYAGMAMFAAATTFADRIEGLSVIFNRPVVRRVLESAAVLLTVLMIYVPDQEAATARIYMGDQFHHYDQCMVGPAWASLAGDILDVDVISQYGLGMPIIVGRLAKILGADHTAFFTVLMMLTLMYFLLWYWLLRVWLKNIVLALAGVWLAIKFQIFHPGAAPFALTYPSETVLRFYWDIAFFILAWGYFCAGRRWCLAGAGVCAGLAVFYMSSTGLCLAVTFYALLALDQIRLDRRWEVLRSLPGVGRLGAYALIVPLTAVILLALAQGRHLFAPQFWYNIGEFNNYFLSGFGTMPVYESLVNKNFWEFWIGIIIPLLYLWTVVYLGSCAWRGRITGEQCLAIVVSVYGLGLYHYYIARSALTNFYAVGVPFVAIMCFWINAQLTQRPGRWRQIVPIVLACSTFVMLWVNPQFAAYPNVFNPWRHYDSRGLGILPLAEGKPYFNHSVIHTARIPVPNSLGNFDERLPTEADFKDMEEVKRFFRQEFNFSTDARLIDVMTAPKDKVALISSFDVRILMQAKRRPFFYHYPFFLSRPMRMFSFAVPATYTVGQIKRTITQMETEKPEYIFIEKIYSKDNVIFANSTHALQVLLLYVHTHYEPVAQGEYLMALKRK